MLFRSVFKVSLTSGVLTNFAGSATSANPLGGYGGDGGPATQALLNAPQGLAVFGNTVYIADLANNPRALASACPINETASAAPVITPSVPLARDRMRLACKSSTNTRFRNS